MINRRVEWGKRTARDSRVHLTEVRSPVGPKIINCSGDHRWNRENRFALGRLNSAPASRFRNGKDDDYFVSGQPTFLMF